MIRRIIKSLVILTLILTTVTISFGDSSSPRPVIVFGDDFNYPPYSYTDKEGTPVGFNHDIARAVANAMGYDALIVVDEWHRVRDMLVNGEIDAISGMFYSPERENIHSFTMRHSTVNGDIFARKGHSIKSLEDLRGNTVVVQKGDIIGEYLASIDLDIHIVEIPTIDEIIKLLSNGTYNYAALLKLPGLYSINNLKISNVNHQNLPFVPLDYCMAVNKDNEQLLIILNAGLNAIIASGEYSEIFDRWFAPYNTITFYNWLRINLSLILMVIAIIIALIMLILFLRLMIKRKTLELIESNHELKASKDELEASYEELTAMEEELRAQFDNITETNKILKKSEERNSRIIKALPDIVFTINREGRFIDCSEDRDDELFVPRKLFLGRVIEEVLPSYLAELFRSKLIKVFKTSEVEKFDYELTLKGRIQSYEVRIVKSKEDEAIAIVRNISTEKLYQEKIEFLSFHDQLTKLYNRRYFEESLRRLDTSRNLPLCLIMIDVNGLKLINDSFGHKLGDELLIRVAEILRNTCRHGEIISRIGGDEFVVLIPKMDDETANALISRINSASSQERVANVDVSLSIGYAIKHNIEDNLMDILNVAENNMYKMKLFEGPSMRGKTINTIIKALHEKNRREELHSRRVSLLISEFAKVLDMSEAKILEIKNAGLLHDIGKIAINDTILNKPGKLSDEEYDEIKRHPEIGYRILSSVNDMSEMADYVLYHHERWDGKGYPRGLVGTDIPLEARIITLADTYDAITSERSYRSAMSKEAAIIELRKCSGFQFDPNLVEPFVEMILSLKDD